MSSLSARNQLLIGLVLALTMIATRLQHACGVGHILDASWAVFFLGGFYLRSSWAFAALMAEAVLVDLAATTWGGVSSFCIRTASSTSALTSTPAKNPGTRPKYDSAE